MAASLSTLSPRTSGAMAARRVPLAEVRNGLNSPFRGAGTKRSRDQARESEDEIGQSPVKRRQMANVLSVPPRTPTRKVKQAGDAQILLRKTVGAMGVYEKKPLSKDKSTATARSQASNGLSEVEQWQQHYSKMFPQYVFYFESVPDGMRRQYLKLLFKLGATEAQFFSRDVTHVVTTRDIPKKAAASTSTDASISSSTVANTHDESQPRTINPSLLEKSNDSISKPRFTFEVPHTKSLLGATPDGEPKRRPAGQTDMLQRAQSLGIKVWRFEKFQRVMEVMHDFRGDGAYAHDHNTRSTMSHHTNAPKATRQGDLSLMIKNEQLNEGVGRDAMRSSGEMITLKGPYIFVSDMNEKTKPVMVREYPAVKDKADGQWPQFRSAMSGKCPFIEEDPSERRYAERAQRAERAEREERTERHRAQRRAARKAEQDVGLMAAPRTRSATQDSRMDPPTITQPAKMSLAELQHGCNAMAPSTVQHLPPLTLKPPLAREASLSANNSGFSGFSTREPLASGMQPSNITSAIRSQMVSSTAAGPGAKAGMSKEMFTLRRKVLEDNSVPSLGTLTTSRKMLDIAGSARLSRIEAPTRAAKQRAQARLGHKPLVNIREDVAPSDEEEAEEAEIDQLEDRRRRSLKGKRAGRREAKPGYCENCKDKFDDFEEHIESRKHRKFAVDRNNWAELDEFLACIRRPLKERSADLVGSF